MAIRKEYYKDNPKKLEELRKWDRKYQREKRKNKRELKSKENKDYNRKHKDRVRANSMINNLIKRGEIIRLPCEICGYDKTHAHHPNYKKPLEVIWLCSSHHKLEHIRQKNEHKTKRNDIK
jgi:hypothetical protein